MFYVLSISFLSVIISDIFDNKYENFMPNPCQKRLISDFLETRYPYDGKGGGGGGGGGDTIKRWLQFFGMKNA